jgi:two-component system, chemotaxis family, chemotaxis protein CheY
MALDTKPREFVIYASLKRAAMRENTGDSDAGPTKLESSDSPYRPGSSDPRQDPDADNTTAAPPPTAEQMSADVLVVDDESDVRWTVAEVLRSAGFSVAEAQDGDIALRLLSTQHYRMVLLDIRMPNRDGVSLIETAETVPPVVVHSAYALDASERERLGASVVSYLHKPVSPQKLLRAVEAVLGSGTGPESPAT